MTKYIKVDWPDSQRFADNEECYIAIPIDPTNYEISGNTYMVPEDLYNEVMNKLEFPKKYENTNLGTIVCYETRAIVNGNQTYWYDESNIQKGNIALIYNHNDDKWYISKIVACSEGFPIVLEDSSLLVGINCELIGHYDPELPF